VAAKAHKTSIGGGRLEDPGLLVPTAAASAVAEPFIGDRGARGARGARNERKRLTRRRRRQRSALPGCRFLWLRISSFYRILISAQLQHSFRVVCVLAFQGPQVLVRTRTVFLYVSSHFVCTHRVGGIRNLPPEVITQVSVLNESCKLPPRRRVRACAKHHAGNHEHQRNLIGTHAYRPSSEQ
jgi:hypothetical protein